jgi:hypothetical protein
MGAGPSPSGCTTNCRARNARSFAQWPTLEKIFCSGMMYDNVPRHAWSPPNFPHSEDEAIIQHYRHLGGESTAIKLKSRQQSPISLSACSSMWQCQTYFSAKPSNLTMILVIVRGSTRTVSFQPNSPAGSSAGGQSARFVCQLIDGKIERPSVRDLSLAYSVLACFKT